MPQSPSEQALTPDRIRANFFSKLKQPLVCEDIFDTLTDTVFFVKDHLGRYVVVNQTLVDRLGVKSKQELIGRTVLQVFPESLAENFAAMDKEVLLEGKLVNDRLQLHLFRNRRPGWSLLHRHPVYSENDKIIGLIGMAKDLHAPNESAEDYKVLAKVIDHIQQNYNKPLKVPELAQMAGMSPYQFDQRVRKIFYLSPGQFLNKTRIDHACYMLTNTDAPISDVAFDCGYADQSAFTRQFRQTTGMTPRVYRQEHEHHGR